MVVACQDWAQQEKAKQQKILEGWNPDAEAADGGAAVDEEEEADDDELPFACFICRRRWEDCQVGTLQSLPDVAHVELRAVIVVKVYHLQ